MNDIVKKTIIDTINANNINLKRTPGTDEYTVINQTGQPVLNVVNGWDYGIYGVNVGGIVVSYIECNPDAPNKTPEQIATLQIVDACCKRYSEIAKQRMLMEKLTQKDKDILNILNNTGAVKQR